MEETWFKDSGSHDPIRAKETPSLVYAGKLCGWKADFLLTSTGLLWQMEATYHMSKNDEVINQGTKMVNKVYSVLPP